MRLLALAILIAGQCHAQTLRSNGIDHPGPTWASFTGNWAQWGVNVGAYPANALFGQGNVPMPDAIRGAINAPASITASASHVNGVAGYARTLAVTAGAVGVFGMGTGAVNGSTGGWGGNFVVSNCATNWSCSVGEHIGTSANLYGVEIDVGAAKMPGGAAYSGFIRGLYIIGAGDSTITNGYAIDVDSPGFNQSPVIKWPAILHTVDGSTNIGVDLGANGVGNGVASQSLRFRNRTSGGTNQSSTINADANGVVNIVSGGNSFALLDASLAAMLTLDTSNGLTIPRNLNFSSNGGHIWQAAANKDIAGVCTFSGTTCTVTFTTAYNGTPSCTANDQTAAAPVRVAPTTTQVVLTGGTGAGATDVVSYHCIGNPN